MIFLRNFLIHTALIVTFVLTSPSLASAEESNTLKPPAPTDDPLIGWRVEHQGFSNDVFYDVWGSSESDVFVVGAEGLILHYDGSTWSEMDSGTTASLGAIFGFGPNDVFVVGGDLLHYDGVSWSSARDYLQVGRGVSDVWGTAPDNVFAVAGPIFLHYDGERWRLANEMVPDQFSATAIWGSGPNDIYVMGGDNNRYQYHFDGTSWNAFRIRTDDNPEGIWDIPNIWGSGPDDIFAGKLHFDGTEWEVMEDATGWQVWGTDPNNVFAAAAIEVAGYQYPLAHFDGTEWRKTNGGSEIQESGTNAHYIKAIWGPNKDKVYAVGTAGVILSGPRFDVRVGKAGTGSGDIQSDNQKIQCGDQCLATFDLGARVTLTTTANEDSSFLGWSGDCEGIGECVVEIDRVTEVTAIFNIKQLDLTINKVGTGSGYVEQIDPNGDQDKIDCGQSCQATYPYDTRVILQAVPDADSFFTGWGEGACSGIDPCAFFMTENRVVSPIFTQKLYSYLPLINGRR